MFFNKKLIIVYILFSKVLLGCITDKALKSLKKAEKIITPVEMQYNINIIASDKMKGRDTPSKELDSAANFIATAFKNYGLQTVNNSYFQIVPFYTKDLGRNNYFKVTRNGKEKKFKLKSDYIPFEMSADTAVNASLVFAGYGISAPEYDYDDYDSLEVKGKIVVIFSGYPGEKNNNSIFKKEAAKLFRKMDTKVDNALKHGAVGMIVITNPLHSSKRKPTGYAWSSISNYKTESLPLESGKSEKGKIPVIHADDDIATYIFTNMDSLKYIQKKIDQNMQPFSFFLDSIQVSMKTNVIITDCSSKNVVGYLEGKDPVFKNEILVIGAHYDHIGYKTVYKAGEDYIYNGADDNASGTAGVMSIAKAFTKIKSGTKRSILFILFTAEEKGLLGSKYYVDNPLFPLEKTVAMINLDMIGRNADNSLTLEGSSKSPDITAIIKNINEKYKFNFVFKKETGTYLGGSDHYNFYLKSVPMIFFFTGIHSDYHQVSDNPDKINVNKAAKISRLVFCTAWYIANDNKYYKLIKQKKT